MNRFHQRSEDLAPKPPTGVERIFGYYADGTHFTLEGNRAMAAWIVRELRRENTASLFETPSK